MKTVQVQVGPQQVKETRIRDLLHNLDKYARHYDDKYGLPVNFMQTRDDMAKIVRDWMVHEMPLVEEKDLEEVKYDYTYNVRESEGGMPENCVMPAFRHVYLSMSESGRGCLALNLTQRQWSCYVAELNSIGLDVEVVSWEEHHGEDNESDVDDDD